MKYHGLLPGTFITGLIIFLLGVCGIIFTPTRAIAFETFEVVKTDEFEGVIVAREKAKDFMKAFSGLEEKESWTPGKDDVLKLEEKIESYLKKAAVKRSPNLWSKLAPYKRQYIGIMRNNRRVIFVNFFCQAYDINWKTTPVAVEDGGDCFFSVIYDVDRASFSDLRVNGEA